MKKIIFATLLLGVLLAKASGQEGGHHADEGIPFDKIGWQAANLGILVVAIVYFIKKSITDAFLGRKNDFMDQAEKTKSALKGAEIALSEVKSKLSLLESGEKNSIENAKKEAQLQQENFITEAALAVEKMKSDAKLMMANELLKAKSEITQVVVDQAVKNTQKKLEANRPSSGGGSQEAEFIKQLSQVQA